MATPLDEMLEADEQVVFRTPARPARIKALVFGLLLALGILATHALVGAMIPWPSASIWGAVVLMIGSPLGIAFAESLRTELIVTDRRLLLGGSMFAWLFGIGSRAHIIAASDIDQIAGEPGKYQAITIVLLDGRRFSFWFVKDRNELGQSLAELSGKPWRRMIPA